MKTAVIILNWNGSLMLRKFLPSVVKNTIGADIVVADNGSTDDSLDLLRSEFQGVSVLEFDKNYGFAEGYNRAIAQVDAEYVVLLNSDVETPVGWLQPLIDFMDSHPDCAACQPKLLAYHDKLLFEYAGASGGFIDRFGYPFCRGRILSNVEKDCGQYDDIAEIHWATGACMMVRRNIYIRCGGLDGRFFAHNEEIDLCWRMRLYGHKIVCIPLSHVYHVGGGTLPQGNPRKTYLNFRNNLTMLYKNLPDAKLNSVMRWRTVLDYVAMLQSLLKFNLGDVKAILRARKDFHAWKKEYTPIREEIQKKSQNSANLLMSYSILWRFYVLGRKTFLLLLPLIIVLFASSCSDNQNNEVMKKTTKPVKIAVTPTLDCLPLFVAQEIGIADEMGIKLILKEYSAYADADTAIINGSVDAALTDYVHAEHIRQQFSIGKKNKDTLQILSHHNMQLYLFTGRKSRIREAKQFTDKIIAVDRKGVDAILAQGVLDSVKLVDEKAFLVNILNLNVRQKMLNVNTVDAAVLVEPYATQARKLGHRSLVSTGTISGKHAGAIVMRGKVTEIRDVYNRACDSINKNGIHTYDSVMQRRFTIPAQYIHDIPNHNFKKITIN